MCTSKVDQKQYKLRISSFHNSENVVINEVREDAETNAYTLHELKLKNEYEKAYSIGWNDCQEKMEPIQNDLKKSISNLEKKIDELNEIVEQTSVELPNAISSYLKELEHQLKDELCEVSYAIVEKILSREVDRDANVLSIINKALSNITQFNDVRILLNHEDFNKLNNEKADQIATGLSISSDPSLKKGDVKIECDKEFIDASIAMRFASLKELIHRKLTTISNDCPS